MQNTSSSSGAAEAPRTNGETTLGDLFALSDEQILEIEPEAKVVSGQSSAGSEEPAGAGLALPTVASTAPGAGEATPPIAQPPAATHSAAQDMPSAGGAAEAPPKWLADMMADPQAGGEARDFWNGILKAREDARLAAGSARQLEELDRAYFAGDGPARERLAETLLREDPAAFREMVFAGLNALEEAGKQRSNELKSDSSTAFRSASGTPLGMTDERIASYAAFEKAANEELDRDVGGAIGRVLAQALPSVRAGDNSAAVGAQHAAPLQARLTRAIREDIEAALKGDRQLGEQVALIISGKRPGQAGMHTPHFDDATRAQVVRLIGERARHLVPAAAKRVLNDWTQTALAAHRARAQKTETAAARPDVEGVGGAPAGAPTKAAAPREIDYRRMSDEQILDL